MTIAKLIERLRIVGLVNSAAVRLVTNDAALALASSQEEIARLRKALDEVAALRYAEDEDVYDTLEQALDISDAALASKAGAA